MKRTFHSLCIVSLGLILFSCGNGGENQDKEKIDEEIIDPNQSLNTNFDGKIFSIPSPVQTALLIKQANVRLPA